MLPAHRNELAAILAHINQIIAEAESHVAEPDLPGDDDERAIADAVLQDMRRAPVVAEGFAPSLGDSFDGLDWQNISGTFDDVQLPELDEPLGWEKTQLYATGILRVVLAGDFNFNGVVDAADYVLRRKGLGTVYTQDDYNIWRAHFGQTAGSGSGDSAVVPEPATLATLISAAAGIRLLCRRIA